jgi:hypothetical protein
MLGRKPVGCDPQAGPALAVDLALAGPHIVVHREQLPQKKPDHRWGTAIVKARRDVVEAVVGVAK